jgi:MFS family permease
MNPAGPVIATPTSTEPSDASKHLLPWLVAVAFFMESLDTTILNTAVPAISSALGVAPLNSSVPVFLGRTYEYVSDLNPSWAGIGERRALDATIVASF